MADNINPEGIVPGDWVQVRSGDVRGARGQVVRLTNDRASVLIRVSGRDPMTLSFEISNLERLDPEWLRND